MGEFFSVLYRTIFFYAVKHYIESKNFLTLYSKKISDNFGNKLKLHGDINAHKMSKLSDISGIFEKFKDI
jgi:hypothetical protein